jgi:hypothetical protein
LRMMDDRRGAEGGRRTPTGQGGTGDCGARRRASGLRRPGCLGPARCVRYA